MAKGSIEWELDPGKELVIRFRPPMMGNGGEIIRHTRAARKEMLMAVRGLIDIAVQQMDQADKRTTEKRTRKVTVE